MLALSREDSSLWSHLFGGGRRKPGCGGPAGVAALETEVEKFAVEPRGERRRAEESRKGEGRRQAISLATGLEEAIVEENLGSGEEWVWIWGRSDGEDDVEDALGVVRMPA